MLQSQQPFMNFGDTLFQPPVKSFNDFNEESEFCFFDRITSPSKKLRSNYWKIDNFSHSSTEIPLIYNTSFDIDDNQLAIGSNCDEDNLKVYGLDTVNNYLTHQISVSLPDIHSLKWLYNVSDDPLDKDDFKFLLSGHSNGIVNLSLVPIDNESPKNAEIIKRFNHTKHITTGILDNTRMSNNNKCTNTVYKIDVTPKSWKACNMNCLLSLYRENIFLWDTSRSSYPILKNKVKGVSSFDSNSNQDGLLALSGSFGVSLFDMRMNDTSGLGSSSFYIPLKFNSEASLVKWCSTDSNYLCSANLDKSITVWDIRNLKPLAQLSDHTEEITSLQWVNSNNLYSSSKDGSIIHWDLEDIGFDKASSTKSESVLKCSLKNSFKFDVHSRECGTVIPASNTSIVDLKVIDDEKILSLDQSFLGLHSKMDGRTANITSKRRATNTTLISEVSSSPTSSSDVSRNFSDSVETLNSSVHSGDNFEKFTFENGKVTMNDILYKLNATIIDDVAYI